MTRPNTHRGTIVFKGIRIARSNWKSGQKFKEGGREPTKRYVEEREREKERERAVDRREKDDDVRLTQLDVSYFFLTSSQRIVH